MCIKSEGSNMTIPSESPVLIDDSRIPPLNLFCAIEQPLDLSCKRKRKLSEVSDRSTPSLKSARLGSTSSTDTIDGRPLSADDTRQMTNSLASVDPSWPLSNHIDASTPYNFLNLLSLYRNSSYSPPAPGSFPNSSNLVLSRPPLTFNPPVILNNSQLPVSAASTPHVASPAATAVSRQDAGSPPCKQEPDENQEAPNSRISSNGLRPFKAYTNGALSLTSIKPPTHPDFDQGITEKLLEQSSSEEAYSDYRERWRQMQATDRVMGQKPLILKPLSHQVKKEPSDPLANRGNMSSSSSVAGSGSGSDSEMAYTNPRMKRHPNMTPDEQKDNLYWERRRKNNEAAKRSREARRAKEEEMTIRASFLEQENLKLRIEIASLKSETSRIKCILYNKSL